MHGWTRGGGRGYVGRSWNGTAGGVGSVERRVGSRSITSGPSSAAAIILTLGICSCFAGVATSRKRRRRIGGRNSKPGASL